MTQPQPPLSSEWQTRQVNAVRFVREQMKADPKGFPHPLQKARAEFLKKLEDSVQGRPENEKAALMKAAAESLDRQIEDAVKEGVREGSNLKPGQAQQGPNDGQKGFITRAIDSVIGMFGGMASWVWEAMKNFMPGVSEWVGGIADNIKNTIAPTTPEKKAQQAKEALAQGVRQSLASTSIIVGGRIFKPDEETLSVITTEMQKQDFSAPAPSAPAGAAVIPNATLPITPAATGQAPARAGGRGTP